MGRSGLKREDYIKSRQMTVACEFCKESVTRTRSQILGSNRNYCNKKCQLDDAQKDLKAAIGNPIGEYLTVLSPLPFTKGGRLRYVWCQCKCGNQTKLEWVKVKNGKVISCGCSKKTSAPLTKLYNNLDSMDSRWEELEIIATKSPSLKLILEELAKQYPVVV